jgi:glycosyltransferase involved in cell wall biosynthesis
MLSVILPIYNSEKYLKSVLQSVVNQSYIDFELIIVDDCSTDSSRSIVESFQDRRISYYYNDKNIGPYSSYCLGIKYARRDFLALIDHDDILHPDKFRIQLKKMIDNDLNICATNYFVTNSIGAIIYQTQINYVVNEELIYKPFVFHNPTVMMKKTIIEKHKLFNKTTIFGADYEFYLSLSLHENMIVLADHLSYWRFSSSSFSHKHIKMINESSKKISVEFLNSNRMRFDERKSSYYKILIYYYSNYIMMANKELFFFILKYRVNRSILSLIIKITFVGLIVKPLRKFNLIYSVKKYMHI